MEVAGQWRREWSGKAEYGKVTEDGVTKRVARAMEVLHASAPGARVRVLRAAYHATSGPGAPASSYMLQSSRRVISSGYDFHEPTSLPTKPLEISSVPLETSDVNVERQNYEVTEPDDLDISEPSKWRSASDRNSIRMSSEESSSTENASIIDLDSKTHPRVSFRKHEFENGYESEKSVNSHHNRVSPLLDAPVALSTLKYKSLLNGSDDWNNRRKSYSFEDTASLNKVILDKNDRFAIESSTDSGICKSSEVVNIIENNRNYKLKERKTEAKDETFKDWLFRNKLSTSHPMKPLKEHSITPERLSENNITLQSPGKMCITLPVTVETEDVPEYKKSQIGDEDRKFKKVEFCKTELHFAVDTGTVNIIATDEKPPPTNDFRRRRSAFVPINERFEKSVTLFGDKPDFQKTSKTEYYSSYNETGESDENTAATKSILKNKIPKPKPYLLGENMILGNDDNFINKSHNSDNYHSAKRGSLINSQFKVDRKYSNETKSDHLPKFSSSSIKHNAYRTTNEGSFGQGSFNNSQGKSDIKQNNKSTSNYETVDNDSMNSVKRKLQILQTSPTLGISNSRQLREGDLMYFGVEKNQELTSKQRRHHHIKLYDQNKEQEEIFESVRLVQKVASSVCSSEIESDEAPEYQNVSLKTNYTPVPAPRLRNKYSESQTEAKRPVNLNSIKEQENEGNISSTLRRTRLRRQDTASPSSRSISEPPKINKTRYKHDYNQKDNSKNSESLRVKINGLNRGLDLNYALEDRTLSEDSKSLYVNLRTKEIYCSKQKTDFTRKPQTKKETSMDEKEYITKPTKQPKNYKLDESVSKKSAHRIDSQKSKDNIQNASQSHTKTRMQRTEKLVTPELSTKSSRKFKNENEVGERNTTHREKGHQMRSSCRQKTATISTLKQAKTLKADPERDRNGDIVEMYTINDNKYSLINNTNFSNIPPKTRTDLLLNTSSKLRDNKTSDKHDSKKSKRSGYVINYNDKNGTVSSVRKLKSIKGSSDTRKKTTKENKENSNEQNDRSKQLNKIALQKFPDQQRDQYEKGYMDRASKSKTYVQRSCQLL